jgi:hypothetical protein
MTILTKAFCVSAMAGMSGGFISMSHGTEPIRNWHLYLDGFYNHGSAPVTIYATEQGGVWRSGIASSQFEQRRTYNSSWQYPDLSHLSIVDGRMKGPLTLHVTPDLWVPTLHRGFKVVFDVDAVVTAEGTIAGGYTVRPVLTREPSVKNLSTNGGVFRGSLDSNGQQPKPYPNAYTLTLYMQGSLVGGKPSYNGRCMILYLGFENGRLVSASRAFLAENRAHYMRVDVPLDHCSVSVTNHTFAGKVRVNTETLDLEPCQYLYEFNGHAHHETLVGSYVVTVKRDGQADETIEGSFDGQWSDEVDRVKHADLALDRWHVAVPGHKPVGPGEHPRILFRKSDLPALRARAQSPDGQAILKRLRYLLDGANGENFATAFNDAKHEYAHGGFNSKTIDQPGVYTFSHIVGYGLLYQLTGDKKYAELGKKSFEVALTGQRDRDDRYAFRNVAALRGGPALGWYAVGYDLCYDGWDEDTRRRFGLEIARFDCKGDGAVDLEDLTRGTMPPGSNHFGMQVGGASLALLAVTGEAWVDQNRIDRLLKLARNSMIRNITEGFGNGGFYMEGDGTGSMATYISYLTGLQGWKNVMGTDFVNSGKPNVPMTTMKWLYQSIADQQSHAATGKEDIAPNKKIARSSRMTMKARGAYPHNVWARERLSGGGYFAIGFSGVTDAQKPALLWFYNHNLKEADSMMDTPFDTVSRYPHVSVCAFVNWPFQTTERDPSGYLPLCYIDETAGFIAWRNRWRDMNDTIITVATGRTRGYHASKPDNALTVMVKGRNTAWGTVARNCNGIVHWWKTDRGDMSAFTLGNGVAFGVDFTGASGADVLLVTTGEATGSTVKLGEKSLTFYFPTTDTPPLPLAGTDRIAVGNRTIRLDGDNIVFETVHNNQRKDDTQP